MIEKLAPAREWVDAGQGFEAKESAVRLVGWSRTRRVIVLRRRLGDAAGPSLSDDDDAPQLSFVEIGEAGEVYEHRFWSLRSIKTRSRLVSSTATGDGENIFDEMKNQWGWAATPRTSRPLSARGPAACAVLQLVEHLRPSRRSQSPPRGGHQPAAVPLGDRHAHAACTANDDPRDQFSRQGQARRQGACGRRRVPERLAKKRSS